MIGQVRLTRAGEKRAEKCAIIDYCQMAPVRHHSATSWLWSAQSRFVPDCRVFLFIAMFISIYTVQDDYYSVPDFALLLILTFNAFLSVFVWFALLSHFFQIRFEDPID